MGDGPLSATPTPPAGATMLLDHRPLLLSLPSGNAGGGSYQEMLSQLGCHLQDLGGILVAHSVGNNSISTDSMTTASPTCCNAGCVPLRKDEMARAARAQVNMQGALSTRTIEPKVLEAMRCKIQSLVPTVMELERNEKLWELTGGAKNLPPPVSPWLRDPAFNVHGQHAGDRVNHANMHSGSPALWPLVDNAAKDAVQQGATLALASSDAGSSNATDAKVQGLQFHFSNSQQVQQIAVEGRTQELAVERDCLNERSLENHQERKSCLRKSSVDSNMPGARKSLEFFVEGEHLSAAPSMEPYPSAEGDHSRPSWRPSHHAHVERKSFGMKNLQARTRASEASQTGRKSIEMLRSVAKQASFSLNKSTSHRKLLIGNGRQQRQTEKKQRTTVAMEEITIQQTGSMSDKKAAAPTVPIQDSLVAVVILLNALVMGVSADIKWPVGWDIFEYLFTAFFLGEMLYKMRNLGIKKYFAGPDWTWNNFDFVVVTIALVDLTIGIVIKAMQAGDSVDLSKFTAVKMARLGRLCRLVRLLRFKMFKELKAMVQGVFAGLRVLMWAIILFFAFIFGLAMVIRNVYLDEEWGYMKEAFGTTPWAMFTLFRCFTDGCSAHDGTPLIVHFYDRYGAYFMIIYMLVFLFVTIGLFNLIMAIFVDNVMESTKSLKKLQRESNHHDMEERLREVVMTVVKRRWRILKKSRTLGIDTPVLEKAARSGPILRKLCCCRRGDEKSRMSHHEDDDIPRDENDDFSIDRELFNMIIEDPLMEEMMEVLDVSTSNRWELFDVLDADMSGNLDYEELIVGLMNLRGPTEKSDIVAALLCARNTMQMVQDLQEDQEQFANHAMSEISSVLSAVQILARVMLPLGDEDNG